MLHALRNVGIQQDCGSGGLDILGSLRGNLRDAIRTSKEFLGNRSSFAMLAQRAETQRALARVYANLVGGLLAVAPVVLG